MATGFGYDVKGDVVTCKHWVYKYVKITDTECKLKQ